MIDLIESLVTKPCTGNRYCKFEGVFCTSRILIPSTIRPMFVGGCWTESLQYPDEPTRFVCNRCAHRTLVYDAGCGATGRVWLLCCPFEGEPLGIGNDYLLFDADGQLLERFSRMPAQEDLRAHFAGPDEQDFEGPPFLPKVLSGAIAAFGNGEYGAALALTNRALEIEANNRRALGIRYRSLQRIGREGEAQDVLKKLLGIQIREKTS